MNKMPKRALSVCATFLTLSGCYDWKWKPDPYVGDSKKAAIVNSSGEAISCTDKKIEAFTCISESDISDLKVQIEKVKTYCRARD